MTTSAIIIEELRVNFGSAIVATQEARDSIPTLWIAREKIRELLRHLKTGIERPYRMLYDMTAIDERMRVHRDGQPPGDFTVVYHLLSFDRNEYIRLKVALADDDLHIPTITGIWPAANWYEREIWDMLGIVVRRSSAFATHPHAANLARPSAAKGPSRSRHGDGAVSACPTDKEDREQEALRFRPEEWGMKRSQRGSAISSFSTSDPSTPRTHGVLRIVLQLDGEEIVDAVPEIGFHHRGAEKMGERQTGTPIIPYTDRIDYLGGVMNNLAYLMAVEKLAGIEVPPRAQVIRVMLSELFRIISHLVWYGTFAQDLGQMSPVFYTFNDREKAFDIIEAICGARMHPNWFRIGGVAQDLPEGWDGLFRDFMGYFPPRLDEYDREVMQNRIFKGRTKGVGAFTLEEAIDWGVTGPNLRACGLAWDFRKETTLFRIRPLRLRHSHRNTWRLLRSRRRSGRGNAPKPAYYRSMHQEHAGWPVYSPCIRFRLRRSRNAPCTTSKP